MRRFFLLIGILASLAQSGCGEDPTANRPDDFPLEVEFVPSATTYSNDMDLVVRLTNRSRGTIHVFIECPPRVERRDGDLWLAADLAWQVSCPLAVDLLPTPLAPGASLEWSVHRLDVFEPVPPGAYRFTALIGKMQLSLEPRGSDEFVVTE